MKIELSLEQHRVPPCILKLFLIRELEWNLIFDDINSLRELWCKFVRKLQSLNKTKVLSIL